MRPEFLTALADKLGSALRNSNVPGRLPTHQAPAFWSRPISETLIRPLSPGSWTAFSLVQGQLGFSKRISKYVATTFGNQTISDVQFRFVLNGALLPYVVLANDVDHNKISPSTFPVVWQDTFFLLSATDRLLIQARNVGAVSQLVCTGLAGWLFENAASPDTNAQAVTDDVT